MQSRRTDRRVLVAVVTTLLAAGALAAAALGATSADQTRESYVAKVEPICKTNTKANERILAGVRGQIKDGKLGLAAGEFKQASAAFGKAVAQIGAVPQPPADTAKLSKWLGYLKEETKLLSDIGAALKADKKTKAQELSVRLNHNGNLANNTVLGFEFNYCLIDQSRFS